MWKNNLLESKSEIISTFSLNEGTVFQAYANYLGRSSNSYCTFYKSKKNIVEHIGEWSWGQRITEKALAKCKIIIESGDASPDALYQANAYLKMAEDPTAKINSRTWRRI